MYDNLQKNEALALAVDAAVQSHRQDDWRNNAFKVRKIQNAIREALMGNAAGSAKLMPNAPIPAWERRSVADSEVYGFEAFVDRILSLVKNQHEY